MKTKFLLVIAFIIANSIFSQKEKNIYFIEEGKIQKRKTEKEKTELKITYNKVAIAESNFNGFRLKNGVVNYVAPLILKALSNLIYNPKKYIYASNTKYRFIGSKKIEVFNNAKEISYIKIDNNKTSLQIDFSTENISANDSEFLVIKVDSILLKKTRAKITSNKKTVNLIIEPELEYFDILGNKKIIKLNPFQIDNIKPGLSNDFIKVKENNWVIPNSVIYNSITVKVTEVNSCKKHMDKWRKIIYENNKEKITEKIIENITKL